MQTIRMMTATFAIFCCLPAYAQVNPIDFELGVPRRVWDQCDLQPIDSSVASGKGVVALANHDDDGAFKHFKKAIELDRFNDEALSGMGYLMEGQRKTAMALEAFRLAVYAPVKDRAAPGFREGHLLQDPCPSPCSLVHFESWSHSPFLWSVFSAFSRSVC